VLVMASGVFNGENARLRHRQTFQLVSLHSNFSPGEGDNALVQDGKNICLHVSAPVIVYGMNPTQ
jgi:hypothetical protein